MALNFDTIHSQYNEVFMDAFKSNDTNILQIKLESFNTTEKDLRAPLDQLFRDNVLDLLKIGDVDELQQYVKFCIDTCRCGLTNCTMPVVLLGDIFDVLTLNKCEQMFTFVEKGVHVWKESLFFNSCKNNLLRMCNDLLRRLSRTQNTVFCGRILLFLAKFFPFSERSGLNIVSEFNLENITEYGSTSTSLKETVAELDKMNVDKKFPIDFNLYCKFWSLQDYFRNPNQVYNRVHWKTFASHASNVLSAFSSCKLEDTRRKQIKLDPNVVTSAPDENYFAKFLTNQKLLELQLSDANFRRCILLQFLIIFQYLSSQVKFKSFELKEDQIEWITKMKEMVYTLLVETPPNGAQFATVIKHILKREDHWNTWKNEGCPEFNHPAKNTDEPDTEKRKTPKPRREKRPLGDIIKEADEKELYVMGSPEMTKLWNLCPNNLVACQAADRNFLPTLDSYFQEAIDQLDPSAQIEESFKKINDYNYGWRALRLLARRSPQFFTYSNNPISKLSDYLDIAIKKMAKEKQEKENCMEEAESAPNDVEELLKVREDQVGAIEDRDTEDIKEKKVVVNITDEQIIAICAKLGANWQKLGLKLGYKQDELDFFEEKNTTAEQSAVNMLKLWFMDDQDACLENLCYILEGLGLNDVSELINTEFIAPS